MTYTVDGTSLDTLAFNVVNRAASWYVPPRRGEGLVMSGVDGELAPVSPPFEPGVIAFTMWAIGANENGTYPADRRAQISANLTKLARLFSKSTGLLDVRRIDGATTKQALARVTDAINFESMTGGMRAEFAVGLTIPSVFWTDTTTTSQTLTFAGSSPQTRDYTSFSASEVHMADLKYSLTGTATMTNPRLTDPRSGGWIQYNGTVSSTEILIIDVGLGTVKKGLASNPSGATNVMQNVTRAGHNRLHVMHVDNTGATAPRIQFSGTYTGTPSILVEGKRKYMVA